MADLNLTANVSYAKLSEIQGLDDSKRKFYREHHGFETDGMRDLFIKHVADGQNVTYQEVKDAVATANKEELGRVRQTALRYLFADAGVQELVTTRLKDFGRDEQSKLVTDPVDSRQRFGIIQEPDNKIAE